MLSSQHFVHFVPIFSWKAPKVRTCSNRFPLISYEFRHSSWLIRIEIYFDLHRPKHYGYCVQTTLFVAPRAMCWLIRFGQRLWSWSFWSIVSFHWCHAMMTYLLFHGSKLTTRLIHIWTMNMQYIILHTPSMLHFDFNEHIFKSNKFLQIDLFHHLFNGICCKSTGQRICFVKVHILTWPMELVGFGAFAYCVSDIHTHFSPLVWMVNSFGILV